MSNWVSLSTKEWVDVYGALGISIGQPLMLQNIGQAPIAISVSPLDPVDQIDHVAKVDEVVKVAAGASGLWAKQYRGQSGEGLLIGRSKVDFDKVQAYHATNQIASADTEDLQDQVDALRRSHVKNLKALPTDPNTDTIYNVIGFYAGSFIGGGQFIWNPSRAWSDHTVGTVIASGSLASFDGTPSSVEAFLDWSGVGSGCFERIYSAGELRFSWFLPPSDDGVSVGKALRNINRSITDGQTLLIDGRYPYPELYGSFLNQFEAGQAITADNVKVLGGIFYRKSTSADYAIIFDACEGAVCESVSFFGTSTEFEAAKSALHFRNCTGWKAVNNYFKGIGDATIRYARGAFLPPLPAELLSFDGVISGNTFIESSQITSNNTGARNVVITGNTFRSVFTCLKVTARNEDVQGKTLFTGNVIDGAHSISEVQGGGNVTITGNSARNIQRALQVVPSETGWIGDGLVGNYNVIFTGNDVAFSSDAISPFYITHEQSINQGGVLIVTNNEIDGSLIETPTDVFQCYCATGGALITDPFSRIDFSGNKIKGGFLSLTNFGTFSNQFKISSARISVCGNEFDACTKLFQGFFSIDGSIGGKISINRNSGAVTLKGSDFVTATDNTLIERFEMVQNTIYLNGASDAVNIAQNNRLLSKNSYIKENQFDVAPNCTGVIVRLIAPTTDRSNEIGAKLVLTDNLMIAESDYADVASSPRMLYIGSSGAGAQNFDLVSRGNISKNRNGRACRSDNAAYSIVLEDIVKQIAYDARRDDLYVVMTTKQDLGDGDYRTVVVYSDRTFRSYGKSTNKVANSFNLSIGVTSAGVDDFSVTVLPITSLKVTTREIARTASSVAVRFDNAGVDISPQFNFLVFGIVSVGQFNSIIGI
ncbi:hypothetical protein [Rheinheimera tilapiae]|uniref:Right-handed parallel beta-helix repeat-containing protein n=1 Tax=Rheinheimera tilapiae TaxID=875043 RepID=A0ABV6BCN0_9GAMM